MPKPTEAEARAIEAAVLPKPFRTINLLDPKDEKTDKDFLRISFREEDALWRREQEVRTLSLNEQKKLPRQVLSDDWVEDMTIFGFKEKEYKAREALKDQLPKPKLYSRKYKK